MSRAAPSFFVIVGASGSGKSSSIHIELAKPEPRRAIFDIEHEYGRFGRALSLEGMRQAMIAAGPAGPFNVVYQPATDDVATLRKLFNAFCVVVYAAGAPRRPESGVQLVCDELADVTSANPFDVPPAWSKVARKGRKRYIRVVVATQRPADCDKKIWSFKTRVRVGMLDYDEDQRQLAAAVHVSREEVAALLPLQYIERDRMTGLTVRGTIAWKGGRPVELPREFNNALAAPKRGAEPGQPAIGAPQKKPARPSPA